ncbi:MAG: Rrf2 family transcriptional regulator [Clostridia bacterium]|nr:Rrf2 family transcriptional regulator [Clostridia bacterium]
MKISTKGRYAIRLMLDIAKYSAGGNVSLKDVSARQDISLKYLEQIVNMLSHAGLVRSQRGAQGGYRLARSAEEITVGDILRVTEGDIAPVSCLADTANTCPRAAECFTLPFWKGLYRIINEYLDNTTVSDLLNNKKNDAMDMSLYI